MKERWERLKKISAWSKKHSFLAVCAFCVLVCILICIGFFINYLCSLGSTQTVDDDKSGYTIVSFSDPEFEAAVRSVLSRPEGDIYEEELCEMTSLTITNQPALSDIEDIRLFPNLTSLRISGCCVYDVSPVAALKYLETLNLSGNKIKDIEPLFDIESLSVLDVSNNNISRIPDDINRLNYLQQLYISDNQISDIQCLSNNSSLTALYIQKNKLTEVPDLSGMELLQTADFSQNAISTVAPMAGLKSIESLSFSSNCLNNIDFLLNQMSLQQVNISYNNIQDISALSTCLNFETLVLYGVEEFDLTPLHSLDHFNSIYVDQCFDRSNIDFLIDHFRTGDKETIHYIISKRNMIEN